MVSGRFGGVLVSENMASKTTTKNGPATSVAKNLDNGKKADAVPAKGTSQRSKTAPSKSTPPSKPVAPRKRSTKPKATSRAKAARAANVAQAERMLRRTAAVTSYDTYGCAVESEEDYFVSPDPGADYGQCGGRSLKSLMEKRICDKLSWQGVAHCHRPRRYEVRVEDNQTAAYSPCMVLRGRGREGKISIVEVLAGTDHVHARKLQAFRRIYEAEFYLILVAPGAVVDEMPTDAYDEAVLPSEIGSLVARLAE